MKRSGEKYFTAIILAIAVAIALICHGTVEAGWEADWQKLLEAGKKEGKVSVYVSSLAPAVRKQAPIFEEKFGIAVEVTSGRGSHLLRRLRTEKNTGLKLADVVMSGGNSIFGVKKLSVTEPMENKLILPEVTDPKFWYTKDSLPWVDDAKHFFHFYAYPNRDITINTGFVKPGEIQSWHDLLKPKYKGKIVWNDPRVSGSGFNGFCTLIMNKVLDESFYRQLVNTQNVALARNQRQMADWLGRGKYAVAVSSSGGATAQLINAGAPVDHVMVKEGTYLSYDAGNIGIVAEAPHPNAAKVFVNWLLTREGQIFAQKATKYMSSRNDIPTDDVNSFSKRLPGERYFVGANSIEKWVYEEQEKYLEMAKKILGNIPMPKGKKKK